MPETHLSASDIGFDLLGFSIGGFVFFYTTLLTIKMFRMIKYVRLGPSSLHPGQYCFEAKPAARTV